MEHNLKHIAYVYVFFHCSVSGNTSVERKTTVKETTKQTKSPNQQPLPVLTLEEIYLLKDQ